MLKVLITGADGFIGKNLRLHLAERKDVEVVTFTRANAADDLPRLLDGVQVVFHLAGVNRPQDTQEFATGNKNLTEALCEAMASQRAQVSASSASPVLIHTSSTQAANDNPYGLSKRAAEQAVFALRDQHGVKAHVFRLPNVFGKWCRPNYNSAVATFCHNIARGLPVQVNDPAAQLTLVYVDDVIARFLQLMDGAAASTDAQGFATMTPLYPTTVGEVVRQIQAFRPAPARTVSTERGADASPTANRHTQNGYTPTLQAHHCAVAPVGGGEAQAQRGHRGQ